MGADEHALVPLRRRAARPRWVSGLPFGLGHQKPHHFWEMLRTLWQNRDNLLYAWRVLTRGVCDGCALGTTGIRDWTLDGVHLCAVRLGLLRLNTMGAARSDAFSSVEALRRMNGKQLRELGRLSHPLRRRAGERGFSRVAWDEVLTQLGSRLRATDPQRVAVFMTSRGIGNEVYYATQKAVRALGSPHVDNAARLCHSPSTAAMKRTLGLSASTCSYRDWYDAEVIVFFGSNPANDQPVAMKYLYEAKKRGARVLVVNTFREPGMERYWIPSNADSAVFGSRIADDFFLVQTGGDLAFVQAVQRLLIERGQVDESFVQAHTRGFEALHDGLLDRSFDAMLEASGASEQDVHRFADAVGRATTGVFVWSMGLTQHHHGSDTVAAVCCLGLLRGFVGRGGCGLMPIRGHSGVQGGAEMGAYATCYPGGAPIDEAGADHLERHWGFRPPVIEGRSCVQMLEAAGAGELDVFYNIGGNLRDTLPQPAQVERALERVPVRIHQDIVMNHAMLVDPAEEVWVLPARTRYEHAEGVTETSTERRVIYSPHVPGHDVGEAREEWWIPTELVCAARPDLADRVRFTGTRAIREEIDAVLPSYRGIAELQKQGDQFQWGGTRLAADGAFPLPGGRARLELAALPQRSLSTGELHLSTRRGKQFNSMVQGDVDGLTGATRDDVLISADDLAALGLQHGQRVRVHSRHGSHEGRLFRAPMRPGNLQMFWPEANVLIAEGTLDPGGRVPDYNAVVRLEPL